MTTGSKLKVLFLCTGNSCRSQMAEGWVRTLKAAELEAWSAGVDPKGVDPRAVKVMAEAGVDISRQGSKSVSDVMGVAFDYVVTLCDHAHQSCPAFPGGTRVVHVGFADPPRLAAGAPDEEAALVHYRRVRDEIKAFVEWLPGALDETPDEAADHLQRFQDSLRSVVGSMRGPSASELDRE